MSQKQFMSSAKLIKKYELILQKFFRPQIVKELYFVNGTKAIGMKRTKKDMIQQLLKAPIQAIQSRVQFYERHPFRLSIPQQTRQQLQQKFKKKKIKSEYEVCTFQDSPKWPNQQIQLFIKQQSDTQLKYLHLLWKKQHVRYDLNKNFTIDNKAKYLDMSNLNNYFSQKFLNPYTNKLFNTNREVILSDSQLNYIFYFPIKRIIQEQLSRFSNENAKKQLSKFVQIYKSFKETANFNVFFSDQNQSNIQFLRNPQKLLLAFTALKHYKFIKKKLALMKAFTQISFMQSYNFQNKVLFLIEEYSKYKDISKYLFQIIKTSFLNKFMNLIEAHMKIEQKTTFQFQEYVLNIIKTIPQRSQILQLQRRFNEGQQINQKIYTQEAKLLSETVNIFKALRNQFEIKQTHDSESIFKIANIIQNLIEMNDYFYKRVSFLHLVFGIADKLWNQKVQLGIVNFSQNFLNLNSYIVKNKTQTQQFLHKNFRILTGFQTKISNNTLIKPLQICKFIQKILSIYLKYPEDFYISENFIYDIILFLQHELKTQNILKDLEKRQAKNINKSTLINLTSFFSLKFSQILYRSILIKDVNIVQTNQTESKQIGISSKFIEEFLIKSILTTEKQVIELNELLQNLIHSNESQNINRNHSLLEKTLNIIKVSIQMHKTYEKFYSFLQNKEILTEEEQALQSKKISFRLLRLSSWINQLLQTIQKNENTKKIYQQAQILSAAQSITNKFWNQKTNQNK